MRPEITHVHLEAARAIAQSLARTTMGRMAGADELESQAYVVVWDIALAWDERANVPFIVYLRMQLKRRLIDWLRAEYGRYVDSKPNARLEVHLRTEPLDGTLEGVLKERPSHLPGPEDVAMHRDEVRRLSAFLRTRSTREQASMLWPLHSTANEVAQNLGLTKGQLASHRRETKIKAQRYLEAS